MTHCFSTVLVFQLVFVVVVVVVFVFCLARCLSTAIVSCSFKLKVYLPLNKIGKRAFLCQPHTSIDVTKLLNIITLIM